MDIREILSQFWNDLNQDMEDLKNGGWSDEEWAEILEMSFTKTTHQIHEAFLAMGNEEGLIKPEVIMGILERVYRGVSVVICQWHFEIAKAQLALCELRHKGEIEK